MFEGITLKNIIHHKCTYGNGNMTEEIYEKGEATELVFTPPVAHTLPDYFSDPKQPCPSPYDFEKIPLAHPQYKINYITRPTNEGVFTPKEMHFEDNITCYWISPRMMILHGITLELSFNFSKHFYHEGITVFTQLEPVISNGEVNINSFRLKV